MLLFQLIIELFLSNSFTIINLNYNNLNQNYLIKDHLLKTVKPNK